MDHLRLPLANRSTVVSQIDHLRQSHLASEPRAVPDASTSHILLVYSLDPIPADMARSRSVVLHYPLSIIRHPSSTCPAPAPVLSPSLLYALLVYPEMPCDTVKIWCRSPKEGDGPHDKAGEGAGTHDHGQRFGVGRWCEVPFHLARCATADGREGSGRTGAVATLSPQTISRRRKWRKEGQFSLPSDKRKRRLEETGSRGVATHFGQHHLRKPRMKRTWTKQLNDSCTPCRRRYTRRSTHIDGDHRSSHRLLSNR